MRLLTLVALTLMVLPAGADDKVLVRELEAAPNASVLSTTISRLVGGTVFKVKTLRKVQLRAGAYDALPKIANTGDAFNAPAPIDPGQIDYPIYLKNRYCQVTGGSGQDVTNELNPGESFALYNAKEEMNWLGDRKVKGFSFMLVAGNFVEPGNLFVSCSISVNARIRTLERALENVFTIQP